MADNEGGAGGGQPGAQNNGGGGSGAAIARPEGLPDKYFDATTGVKVADLWKDHSELGARFAKGKEALIPEIKTQLEAERFKARPTDANAYQIKAPTGDATANLVLLDAQPAADFQPEAGKQYVVIDQKDPLMAWWRRTAFDRGLGQDEFSAGIAEFAKSQLAQQPTPEQTKAARSAEYQKLGENGTARVEHAWGQLQAVLGPEKAKALDNIKLNAPAIEAIETLLEKAGGTKFAGGGGGAGGAKPTLESLKAIQAEPDYWQNPDKQKKVTEGFQKLYGGTAA